MEAAIFSPTFGAGALYGIDTYIHLYWNGKIYWVVAEFRPAAETLGIYTPGGDVVVDAALPPITDFVIVKLVMDSSTRKYVRLLFNNKDYYVANYDLVTQTPAVANLLQVAIVVTCTIGNQIGYVGHVIVTDAEPSN